MKKVFVSLALGLALTPAVFASTGFTPFTTVDQARLYCPAENALSFTPNSSAPNAPGIIAGVNQKLFTSFPGQVIRPMNLNRNNIIGDAQFRNEGGQYGYNSNGVITCFYSYKTFIGWEYALVLRSK